MKFSTFSSDFLIALIFSLFKYTASSLSRDGLRSVQSVSFSLSPILSRMFPSATPPNIFKDISVVAPASMLLSSIVSLVVQHFSLVHEEHSVSWDQCLSFHYFHYLFGILSSVAFDADCLSSDCLHIHCHVRLLKAILDFAFLECKSLSQRARRCNPGTRILHWTDELLEPATGTSLTCTVCRCSNAATPHTGRDQHQQTKDFALQT